MLARSVLSLSSRALRNSGESFWAASRALSYTWVSSSSFTLPSAPAPHLPAALPQVSGPGSSCGDQVCWRWRRKILCQPTSTLMPCGEGAARQAEPADNRARRSEPAPLKQSALMARFSWVEGNRWCPLAAAHTPGVAGRSPNIMGSMARMRHYQA
jgi:hypothetical protein